MLFCTYTQYLWRYKIWIEQGQSFSFSGSKVQQFLSLEMLIRKHGFTCSCINALFSFQSLRHENLVNLIEVFRRKKRLYLVFEFVDNTILDELERYPNGLDEGYIRKILWQTLRGTEFCHSHNVSTVNAGLEYLGYLSQIDINITRIYSGEKDKCSALVIRNNI